MSRQLEIDKLEMRAESPTALCASVQCQALACHSFTAVSQRACLYEDITLVLPLWPTQFEYACRKITLSLKPPPQCYTEQQYGKFMPQLKPVRKKSSFPHLIKQSTNADEEFPLLLLVHSSVPRAQPCLTDKAHTAIKTVTSCLSSSLSRVDYILICVNQQKFLLQWWRVQAGWSFQLCLQRKSKERNTQF